MTLVLSPTGFNSYYLTNYETFVCCDEVQYKYFCDNHFSFMGCYFCEFDYSIDCEEQH